MSENDANPNLRFGKNVDSSRRYLTPPFLSSIKSRDGKVSCYCFQRHSNSYLFVLLMIWNMPLSKIIFVFAVVLAWVNASPTSYSAFSQGSSRQISPDVLSCSTDTEPVKSICSAALQRINFNLKESGVSVTNEGILFTYDNPDDVKVNTGHRCTVTAAVRHRHASAKIHQSASLNMTFGSLTDPIAVGLQIPISLHARVDVKQRFGLGLPFGGCKRYASDSYKMLGDLSTNANAVIGLSLKPSLGQIASGDYVLEIRPVVVVLFSLESTDLRFRISGVSPLSSVWTFITGFTSTFFGAIDALVGGRDASQYLGALKFDLGAPLVLGLGSLPGPLKETLFRLLDSYGSRNANNVANKGLDKYEQNLEKDLTGLVGKAIGVDETGKRTLIVKKEIVELLNSGGNTDDIFTALPPDPSVACFSGLRALCNSCRGCSACTSTSEVCVRLRKEYNDKYGVTNKMRPGPLAPLPSPSPVTRPPTTQPRYRGEGVLP